MLMWRAAILGILLCAGVCLVGAFSVYADSGAPVSVVFYSGMCNSPAACNAVGQAQNGIGKNLPPGSKLLTPTLIEGRFYRGAGVAGLISDIGSNKIILLAYSAGYNALLQTVNAMNTEQLKRIESIVSLEGDYNGFDAAVARVRTVNPNVRVYKLKKGQVNAADHGSMPGAAGTSQVVNALVTAAQTGATPDLPTSFAAAPFSAGMQSAFAGAFSGASQSGSPYNIPGLSSMQSLSGASGGSASSPSSYSALQYPTNVTYAPATQSGGVMNTVNTSGTTNTSAGLYTIQSVGQGTVEMTPTDIPTESATTGPNKPKPPQDRLGTSVVALGTPSSNGSDTFASNSNDPNQPGYAPVSSETTDFTDTIVQILTKIKAILFNIQNLFGGPLLQ